MIRTSGGVYEHREGVVASLPWSADALQALVRPDILDPVKTGTESVVVMLAKRFIDSLNIAIPTSMSSSLEIDIRHAQDLGQLAKTIQEAHHCW